MGGEKSYAYHNTGGKREVLDPNVVPSRVVKSCLQKKEKVS